MCGRPMVDEFIVAVKLKPGTCRWCGCTERDPCPGGCGWADRQQTLCTSCSHFNKEIQTAAGRKKIAQRLLEA
jgi:hypothetical protein